MNVKSSNFVFAVKSQPYVMGCMVCNFVWILTFIITSQETVIVIVTIVRTATVESFGKSSLLCNDFHLHSLLYISSFLARNCHH